MGPKVCYIVGTSEPTIVLWHLYVEGLKGYTSAGSYNYLTVVSLVRPKIYESKNRSGVVRNITL